MYKFLKTLNGISKFYLNDKFFVYQELEGSILFNGLILDNFIQQIEITLLNNIYINDWEGNFSIYDDKGNLNKKGINQAFFYVSNNYVGRQYIENDNLYESLIDDNNVVIFKVEFNKFNFKNTISKNNYFLLDRNKDIICFDLKEEKEKWSFRFSNKFQKGMELYTFLGVFKKDLLVVLDDSSILRIDIETGELKCQFNMKLFSHTDKEVIAQCNFVQFQDEKLIYYRYGQYAEYDLVLNKITYEFDIKEKLEK